MDYSQINHICEDCSIKGYFPELCRIHVKVMKNAISQFGDFESWSEEKHKNISRKVAYGAGLGFTCSIPCLVLLPPLGLKLALLHLSAAKFSGGLTAAGGSFGLLKGLAKRHKKSRKTKESNYEK